MEVWPEIRRPYLAENIPIMEIARRLGLARNTVREAVRSCEPPRYIRATRPSAVDAVEPKIRDAKDRQRALDRYLRDRDAAALGEATAALDRELAAIQAPRPAEPVPADVAVRFLQELPKTWAKAKGRKGSQMLATSLITRHGVRSEDPIG